MSGVVLLLDGSLGCSFGPGPYTFVEQSFALRQFVSICLGVVNGSIIELVALFRKLLLTGDLI